MNVVDKLVNTNLFTEEQIRATLDGHHPSGDTQYDEPLCSCSTKIGLSGYVEYTADHFVKELKATRDEG